MHHPRYHLIALILLVLLGGVLFFHGLADRDLWSSHEGRAAQDAQSLLDDGFATLPRLFDGRLELQKPPLYYILVALISGDRVDAWSVRLPAAVSGLLGVLVLYGLGARLGRPLAGFLAAAILATALHYTWLARVGRIDMPLTLTTTVVLAAFSLRANDRGGRLVLAAGYLAIALGLLFKGPIGAVLPLAVAGAWLLLRHRDELVTGLGLGLLQRYGLWWGVPLVALLVVPVYLWADAVSGGEFSRVFLWHHNVARGFGGSPLLRAHPWWFYGPQFLIDVLPWSVLFPLAAWFFLRRRELRSDTEAWFGLTWLLVILLLLSLMRFKRADYLVPAYPGAALFLGCLGERLYLAISDRRRLSVAFGAVMLTIVAAWLGYLRWDVAEREPTREYARFAHEIRRLSPAPRPVLFFRTESHALAFHVGRPLSVFVEWENLEAWAMRPDVTYVVMPAKVATEWPQFLRAGRLEEVLRNTDLPGAADHEKPLVLLRTRPPDDATAP